MSIKINLVRMINEAIDNFDFEADMANIIADTTEDLFNK